MRTSPETIRILSLDFDGCVASAAYVKALSDPAIPIPVCEANREFFNRIKTEAEESGVPLVVMLGSNRQSYRVDLDNGIKNKTGSCYPVLRQIAKEIGAEMETVLLSDAFTALNKADDAPLVPGEAYRMAEQALTARMAASSHEPRFWVSSGSSANHPDTCFSGEKKGVVLSDDKKIGLLYFQMHYMAAKHPGKTLIFDFVDDTLSILKNLRQYFTNNPLLIPPNVTLRLSRYNAKDFPFEAENFSPEEEGEVVNVEGGVGEEIKSLLASSKKPLSPELSEVLKKIESGIDRYNLSYTAFTAEEISALKGFLNENGRSDLSEKMPDGKKDTVSPVLEWEAKGAENNEVDQTPHRTLGMIHTKNVSTYSSTGGTCPEDFARDYSQQDAVMGFRSGRVELPVHPSRPVSSAPAATTEEAPPSPGR